AAVGDVERGRVAHLRAAPELDHVVVHVRKRDRVLDAGVAVDDHGHVVRVERAALRYHTHLRLARGLEHHLPLVAPRLVVALHAVRAVGLHAPEVHERVAEAVDVGVEVAFRTIEDGARGEDAGRGDRAGALHLLLREDLVRVVRRIVQRGDPEAERGVVDPRRLRDQPFGAHAAVPMAVDEPGRDRLTGAVDDLRTLGDAHARARTDRGDAAAGHDHDAVVDDLVTLHRHQPGTRERDHTGGLVE